MEREKKGDGKRRKNSRYMRESKASCAPLTQPIKTNMYNINSIVNTAFIKIHKT